MKRLFLLFSFVLLGLTTISQNTSPLVVKDFVLKSNEIIDLEQIPKLSRTDLDNNPICRIKVKAQGFEESVLQKLVFVPNGIEITHMVFKDGQWLLHVSSQKSGEIIIKYMGDCVFRLPYQLEPGKVYEMTLAMETATLVIRTIPIESEIYIDNEKVGVGEAIKAVSIGAEHRYRVSCENYYTNEGVVVFDKRDKKDINVELLPNFGYITIKTEPSKADVYIDEVKVGMTPYMMKKIKQGNHVVELRKNGYEVYADMVAIQIGELNRQLENVTLEARVVAYGTLDLDSEPSNAIITINDRQYGTTPNTLENFEVGTYTIKFTKEGYDELTQTVDVREGKTESLNVVLIKKATQQQQVTRKTRREKVSDGFSVSPTKQVYFSKGNLQYQASTDTWRFAEYQWTILGNANNKISPNNPGWIDLFGWGTGGNPTQCTNRTSDYNSYSEWGDNLIMGYENYKWFTLTSDEMNYLMNTRSTSSGVRYAKAKVNGVCGLILVPDGWTTSTYPLTNVNRIAAWFKRNEITLADWIKMEEAGAVFLPVAGYRNGKDTRNIYDTGNYWLGSGRSSYRLLFIADGLQIIPDEAPERGRSVRLVREVD